MDVIRAAVDDPTINFSAYDGNGNGEVDMVAVLTPWHFGDLCNAHGTVFYNRTITSSGGNSITVEAIITGDQSQSFPAMVGVLAHEYGHVMDLPELYDRTNHGSATDYAGHSAGIGKYGVMGKGGDGYVDMEDVPDGPTPLSAWSRIELDWIEPTAVRTDRDDVVIYDIESDDGNVIQIPVPWSPPPPASPTEYFLAERLMGIDNFNS